MTRNEKERLLEICGSTNGYQVQYRKEKLELLEKFIIESDNFMEDMNLLNNDFCNNKYSEFNGISLDMETIVTICMTVCRRMGK